MFPALCDHGKTVDFDTQPAACGHKVCAAPVHEGRCLFANDGAPETSAEELADWHDSILGLA